MSKINTFNASSYIGFTNNNAIYVEASINTYIKCGDDDYVNRDTGSGYGSASASTSNVVLHYGVLTGGTINSARGYFYIFDVKVKDLTV